MAGNSTLLHFVLSPLSERSREELRNSRIIMSHWSSLSSHASSSLSNEWALVDVLEGASATVVGT